LVRVGSLPADLYGFGLPDGHPAIVGSLAFAFFSFGLGFAFVVVVASWRETTRQDNLFTGWVNGFSFAGVELSSDIDLLLFLVGLDPCLVDDRPTGPKQAEPLVLSLSRFCFVEYSQYLLGGKRGTHACLCSYMA
jgi:hypothetical protein